MHTANNRTDTMPACSQRFNTLIRGDGNSFAFADADKINVIACSDYCLFDLLPHAASFVQINIPNTFISKYFLDVSMKLDMRDTRTLE